jgi:DNA-binding NarL/FixJ family response regulator
VSPLRMMVVYDHRVVRDGLRMALEIEEDIDVVGQAVDGREVVEKAQELKQDLGLMGIMMLGMEGIAACQEIRNLLPATQGVMLTASGDEESVTTFLMAGAQGYVLKAAGRDELLRAIRGVGRRECIMDPSVTKDRHRRVLTPGCSERQREVEQLTPREKEILLLVSQGFTNREVAENLVISEFTARNMVSNILGKLGLRSSSELVRWAFEH